MTAQTTAERGLVQTTYRDDGTILLVNTLALPPIVGTLPARLRHWAAETPQATWLSQDDRVMTFADAEDGRRALARRLLALTALDGRPLLFLAENGINHALLLLAATSVAIPVGVVQPAYAGPGAAPWVKLAHVMEQIGPGLVVADDVTGVVAALTAIGNETPVRSMLDLGWLDAVKGVDDAVCDRAELSVGADTVAKLLFTSGSTGVPKAVPNSQRMMVSNMLGLSLVWPFLSARPPVLVDWLPWSHTFGGNCCFDIALWFGGHMHIDRGRPVPALIGKSIAALKRYRPSIYFNVPVGYELLLPELERDPEFAVDFFGRLDFLFNAGAAMPASLRTRLAAVALTAIGRTPPIVGGWGSTETAPFSAVLPTSSPYPGNLGIPMPGTTIKMVPDSDRYELRLRGPNVMKAYWNDPVATAAAFDDEGFYRIGDAGKLADPDNPAAGIVFDGRVVENFKLSSGTFVNVGALRLAAISAGENLISDAVIAGEGRSDLGLLIFANEAACRDLLGQQACLALGDRQAAAHPLVVERLAALLRGHNAGQSGSSTRFARFACLHEPPSAAHDEITDKGYLNQRRILARRAAHVDALYADGQLL